MQNYLSSGFVELGFGCRWCGNSLPLWEASEFSVCVHVNLGVQTVRCILCMISMEISRATLTL